MSRLVLLSTKLGESKSLVLQPVWGWWPEMKVVTEWLCEEVELMVKLRVEVMLEVDSTWWKCWFKISRGKEYSSYFSYTPFKPLTQFLNLPLCFLFFYLLLLFSPNIFSYSASLPCNKLS